MKVAELIEGLNPDYVKGLTPSEKKLMKKEIKRFSKMDHKDKDAYPNDWIADKKFRDRQKNSIPTSTHTEKFKRMYGEDVVEEGVVDVALSNKAEKTGILKSVLRQVYNRGLAAWRTGHRPGVAQHQWAMARVNSFIVGGPARKVDKDLWDKRK